MANFKIFNIGKANARIDELEKQLAEAVKPSAESNQQLVEALATNETISSQLVQAAADLETAKASIGSLNAQLAELNSKLAAVSAVESILNEACVAMSVAEPEAVAAMPAADKVSAIRNAANTAIAKTGIDLSKLPAAGAISPTFKAISRNQFSTLDPNAQMSFCKSGGKITE